MLFDMFEASKVNSGTVRCTTVQHIRVLEKLLSSGRYAPERNELRKYEGVGCKKCESGEWCFSRAHGWMYREMRKRVKSKNTGGVWLWTHEDLDQNIQAARFTEEGEQPDLDMVVMVLDIPLKRMLRSDVYLWHEVVSDRPIMHRGGLIVDNDDSKAFRPHQEIFRNHHVLNDHDGPAVSRKERKGRLALSKKERKRRKVGSWQVIFDETRWATDVFDGVYGTYDSYVHAVTPFLDFEDLVSIHTRDCDEDWMEEQIEFIRTSEGVRVINLKCENNRVRRRNPAILRHMRILGKYRGKAKRKRGGLRKLRSPVPVSDHQGPVSAKDIIGRNPQGRYRYGSREKYASNSNLSPSLCSTTCSETPLDDGG